MYRLVKRVFDITASFIGLLILAPLLLVLAGAVMLDSPGPPLYQARRVGRRGREFGMFKFRTMRLHADQLGPGITTSGDSRITRLGGWLRRAKLDELPQLWNVLLGQMSFVGPRPEDPRYVAYYTPEQRRVLTALPGITGLAAVHYRREESLLSGDSWEHAYITEFLPHKLALELGYCQRPSLSADVLIILATVCPHILDKPWVKKHIPVNHAENSSTTLV